MRLIYFAQCLKIPSPMGLIYLAPCFPFFKLFNILVHMYVVCDKKNIYCGELYHYVLLFRTVNYAYDCVQLYLYTNKKQCKNRFSRWLRFQFFKLWVFSFGKIIFLADLQFDSKHVRCHLILKFLRHYSRNTFFEMNDYSIK